MEPRHERIARIALASARQHGLALAGGYAVNAHGMGNRPSGARDFLDIDAVLTSGRYTRERLLTLAADADAGFDIQVFAQALGELSQITDDAFEQYGISADDIGAMRDRFANWRRELCA